MPGPSLDVALHFTLVWFLPWVNSHVLDKSLLMTGGHYLPSHTCYTCMVSLLSSHVFDEVTQSVTAVVTHITLNTVWLFSYVISHVFDKEIPLVWFLLCKFQMCVSWHLIGKVTWRYTSVVKHIRGQSLIMGEGPMNWGVMKNDSTIMKKWPNFMGGHEIVAPLGTIYLYVTNLLYSAKIPPLYYLLSQ